MVESRSMVKGPSPGPAPACQARASNSRLTRSSWRTWPHRKLRKKVPSVDGALTVPPRVRAVPPARSASASLMQSPLAAGVGLAWGAAQVEAPVNQFTQAEMLGQGGRQEQPGIGHQAVVVEGDADAVGVVAW